MSILYMRSRSSLCGTHHCPLTEKVLLQREGVDSFFLERPESCVFEMALESLVGVGTYKKILRPTKNPTLAGMDPITEASVQYISTCSETGISEEGASTVVSLLSIAIATIKCDIKKQV